MTLISASHRFVFVHIPKSGGTSVKYALAPLQAELGTDTIRRTKHSTATQLRQALPQIDDDNWFTFAFVRNPYDQLFSYWTYKSEHPFHPDYARTVACGDFAGWVEDTANDPKALQSAYTHDADGRQIVDFIGRYERLADDFATVTERIGVGAIELPRVNRSSSADTTHRYDPDLRAFVAQTWARDFELFGYEP